MKVRFLLALFLCWITHTVYAFEPFVVRDIRIEGIQRTEAGTVFSYLPIHVGDTLTSEKASTAIKALFETGFFKDVQIEGEGDILVVSVVERPAIASVRFTGLSDLPEEELKKALREVGLAEGRIFDPSVLDRAERELKNQYLSRGRYAVQISTVQTPLERNRLAINFVVDEANVAKIKQIHFVGNKSFSDKKLLDLFDLGKTNWLSWYTKRDRYSKERLAADLEKLRNFYQNQGYLEFTINSTQVSISPDKTEIYITVNLTEGPVFHVSTIDVSGQFEVAEAEVKKAIKLKPGSVFSRELLTESTTNLSDLLGTQGYAFANVSAIPDIDRKNHTVAIRIVADPGRRIYIRRINIFGNIQTRDEVIRREFRQLEGAWYNTKQLARSKERVERLSFFESVTMETVPVPGVADQIDVNLTVVERNSGVIQAGLGYSDTDKIILSGSISQENVLGTGNTLSLEVSTAKVNRNYSLSFTDPYYTVDGISRGFDIYMREFDATQYEDLAPYKYGTKGLGVHYGIPLSEKTQIHAGLSYEWNDITIYKESPLRYKDFVKHYGNKSRTLLGTVSLVNDSRDSILYPTSGSMKRLSLSMGLPGGSLYFYKISYDHRQYIPITDSVTFLVGGQIGYGDGYGGKPLPFFENFYGGGIGTVRGYGTGTLGPLDEDDYAMGGDRIIAASAEVFWPVPGLERAKTARFSVFFDAGQVYGEGTKFDLGDLRYSTGVGFFWLSPMGPMYFSYAYPLNKKPMDTVERFQFTFGTTF